MTATPWYNSDHIILQAAHEILSDSDTMDALVAELNTRFDDDLPLAEINPVGVESCIAADDATLIPQQPVAVRFDLLSNRLLKRGVSIGSQRSVFRLQVRVLLRCSTLPDATANAALGGKGYVSTGHMQLLTRLRNLVLYALERSLVGFKIANPDPEGNPLCTGIYNLEGPFAEAIDRPLQGDTSLLRASASVDVFIKTRSGVGTTSPV